jgi:hypothetical protein
MHTNSIPRGDSPPLTLFPWIYKEMSEMNFHVTREAVHFATEARIHHMCIVAGLVRTYCLGGPAHILVTNLGPERFTEWKTALINEATGKMPRLFSTLENDVMRGKFEPGEGALVYVLLTPGYDINKLMEDMVELRKVLKDLRRAELIAAKEHDRVRAAARGGRIRPGIHHLEHPGQEAERRRPTQGRE